MASLKRDSMDKEWLYERYWRDGLTLGEVGEEVDVSGATVRRRLEELGIQTRREFTVDEYIARMRPRKWYFDQYWREWKSTRMMAEEIGLSNSTVGRIMKSFDPPIKTRDQTMQSGWDNHMAKPTTIRQHRNNGYIIHNVGFGGKAETRVQEHRITAIGEYGLDAVKENHIHHANNIPWLNVPVFDMDIPELENPNLVPMDPITHAKCK